MSGVLSPVVTAFGADLRVDHAGLVAHCRRLLQADLWLGVFGTHSEGNSLSVAERAEALHALVDAGLSAARMMPGTGGCSPPDVVALTREAVQLGCRGVRMRPPANRQALALAQALGGRRFRAPGSDDRARLSGGRHALSCFDCKPRDWRQAHEPPP